MSDLTTLPAPPIEAEAGSLADRMSRRVAAMGGRLAQLLARAPLPQSPALAQALDFLAAMQAAAPGEAADEGPTRLDRLAASLDLMHLERDLIALAAMPEEHEGYASVLRAVNPRGEPYATPGLAAQIDAADARARCVLRRALEEGAAARTGILELSGDAPFFERNLRLAPGLWSVLCGVDARPAPLETLELNPVSSGLQRWLARQDVTAARQLVASRAPSLIVIVGESESAAAQRAAALVESAGRTPAGFDLRTPGAGDRLALVHALARDAVPVFRLVPPEGPAPASLPRLDGFPGPVIVCARRAEATTAHAGRPVIVLPAPPLASSSRADMWSGVLPELAGQAAILASRYAIEPAVAADVAADLRAHAAAGGTIDLDAVAACVRARCHVPAAAGVAMRRPSAGWGHLVLRPDRRTLLVEALSRLRHQPTVLDRWKFLDGRPGARGVRMLFSGPPGTGKTLSAEVMAGALGVDLMIIDISRVVSKWIGETEKHLSHAFDAAERTQAVLLFDEADALFGKRTEVSDAHDRYANLETAYLLSRLEQFDGLVILSTNLKQNIDPAFLRRLEFVVDFDEPTAAEREALWRCHLPPDAPLAPDVDLRELAQLYPIVGGLIRNASVAAGFLAAEAGTPIGRRHFIGAIRREYQKSAKAFPGTPAGVSPA